MRKNVKLILWIDSALSILYVHRKSLEPVQDLAVKLNNPVASQSLFLSKLLNSSNGKRKWKLKATYGNAQKLKGKISFDVRD